MMVKGPNLPVGIRFPCILDINGNKIFMIGPSWTSDESVAYIYNQVTAKWTHLGFNYPCQKYQSHIDRFTCAYLKHENSIISGVNDCVAILNLTSLHWSSMMMPHKSCILFNSNSYNAFVFFIGTDKINGSEIYMVSSVDSL